MLVSYVHRFYLYEITVRLTCNCRSKWYSPNTSLRSQWEPGQSLCRAFDVLLSASVLTECGGWVSNLCFASHSMPCSHNNAAAFDRFLTTGRWQFFFIIHTTSNVREEDGSLESRLPFLDKLLKRLENWKPLSVKCVCSSPEGQLEQKQQTGSFITLKCWKMVLFIQIKECSYKTLLQNL